MKVITKKFFLDPYRFSATPRWLVVSIKFSSYCYKPLFQGKTWLKMISRKQLKINSFLLLILSIIYFIALNIKSASAADGSINVSLLTNDVEFLLENVNAILAVGVAIVAFYLTKSLKGSPMAKGWNIIVIGVIMFAILEVYNVNRGLGFLHVSGLGDILEFLTILFLLVGFVTIYRSYK